MRCDLGDSLEDEAQVAYRNALGQQHFQHTLNSRIGNVRRREFVEKALVFRGLRIQKLAHVLVGQQLRQIVANDLTDVGQQHGLGIDRRKSFPANLLGVGFRNPECAHPEGRLAHFISHYGGRLSVTHDHKHVPNS